MTFSRYEERATILNGRELYRELLERRAVKFITQYATPNFRYPEPEEFAELDIIYRTWSIGDRFWKMADEYYGSPEMWWVIAWFNKTPTEAEIEIGEQILIPRPFERVVRMLGL